MPARNQTVADLKAVGWVPTRRLAANPAHVRVLGKRREVAFGGRFNRVDELILDLSIDRPGQPPQLVEACRFRKINGLDRANLDESREKLTSFIVASTGLTTKSLGSFRREWAECQQSLDGRNEDVRPFFDDPGRELLFQDLADFHDLLDAMVGEGNSKTAEVASLARRLFFRGGDVVRHDLKRRFESATDQGIAGRSQRHRAGGGRGKQINQEAEAWRLPCWRWACANLAAGWTYPQFIDFVLDNWADRPFAPLGPRGKAEPPSDYTLRDLIPAWKRNWPKDMR